MSDFSCSSYDRFLFYSVVISSTIFPSSKLLLITLSLSVLQFCLTLCFLRCVHCFVIRILKVVYSWVLKTLLVYFKMLLISIAAGSIANGMSFSYKSGKQNACEKIVTYGSLCCKKQTLKSPKRSADS